MPADAAEELYCVVVGSGMVGSAAAASLASHGRGPVALVGPVAQPSTEPPFSSHDDYSRVVSVVAAERDLELESARSMGEYRRLEEETGVTFYHETGYVKVEPGGEPDSAQLASCRERWPFFAFGAVAGEQHAVQLLQEGAGWIDPRAHVRAVRQRCDRLGVEMVPEIATALSRDDSSGRWQVTTAGGATLSSRRVALALGSFINLSGLLPRVSVDIVRRPLFW